MKYCRFPSASKQSTIFSPTPVIPNLLHIPRQKMSAGCVEFVSDQDIGGEPIRILDTTVA
jgi:hypothetical protein